MEFRLENPHALLGLILILPYLWRCLWKRKYLSDSFHWRRTICNTLILLFCFLGLSRPQGGESITTQVSERSNLFIAIDISQSMLAQDTLPSRMKFATDFSQKLIDQLTQVKIALYPFALNGYIQMPLSSDLQAAKDLLASMSPSMATGQGTELGATLMNLLEQIQKSEKISKTRGGDWVRPQILLISDGESHVPVEDTVAYAFKNASIPIFSIAVGKQKPVPIPLENKFGGTSFQKDPQGKTVLTEAHPDILKRISQITGGDFYTDSFQEIPKIVSRLNQSLQIGKLSTGFKLTREFYPLCFLFSFFLLLIEFLTSRWEFAIRALILILITSGNLRADEPMENEAAAIQHYNTGVDAYQTQNLKEAATEFEKSVFTSLDPSVRKKALFNLGNVYLKMGEFDQALQAYQQSYDTKTSEQPFDQETNQKISDNLALLQRLKKMQQNQKSNTPKPGSGENEGDKKGQGDDPKGPKKFEDEGLSDRMKQKVLDLISEEERDTLKRLADDKNKKSQNRILKPW